MRYSNLNRFVIAGALILAVSFTARAQSKTSIVGTWEETGGISASGEPGSNNVGMRRVFTPDGFYAVVLGRVCPGAPLITYPIPSLSKSDLIDRLSCVIAGDGKYTVEGDKLNITRRPRVNTSAEATHAVMQWKVDSDTLTLKLVSDEGGDPVGAVTRFQRLSTHPTPGDFVGVWEETHSVSGKGQAGTGNAGMRRIFTADGFYSITYPRQCAGTQAAQGKLADLTKEQIADRLRCVIAQEGSIRVDGDKLYIHRHSDNNPGNAPSDQIMQWAVTNGELSLKIIANNNPATVGEITYYKRLQ